MSSVQGLIQTTVASWEELRIPVRREELEKVAASFVDGQEKAKLSRKSLAEATKDFKKNAPDAARLVMPLLKMYQDEIDSLSKRARSAESAFVSAFEVLCAVPDPTMVLLAAADIVAEVSELKNQEVTIRRLEDDIRTMRERSAEETKSSVQNVGLEFQQQINQLKASKAEVEHELHALRGLLEKTAASGKTRLEFMEDQVKAAEEEVGSLRAALASAKSQIPESQVVLSLRQEMNDIRSEFVHELQQKEKELTTSRHYIAKLEDDIARKSVEEKFSERDHANELQKLKFSLSQSQQEVVLLRAQKDEAEALRRRLSLLQSMHGALVDEEEDINDGLGSEVGSVVSAIEQQQAVKRKMSLLEGDLAKMRVHVATLSEENLAIRKDRDLLKVEFEKSTALCKKLEDDLLKVSVGNVGGDHVRQIDVLTAQRDRLKSRILELEKEVSELQGISNLKTREADVLRSDNLKLYERIRALESQSNVAFSPGSRSPDVENKYHDIYVQEQTNPFSMLDRHARDEHVRRLNPAERILLSFSKFFLSNKQARMFLFFYILFLHLFVFLVMTRFMFSGGRSTDTRFNQ